MISKKIIILVCLSFFIASCSSSGGSVPFFGGGNKQGSSEKPTSGVGLTYSFKIDDERLPDVNYDLILKNNGDKPIIIKEENFKFNTIDRYDGKDVFTQESLDEMRKELFSGGVRELPVGQEFRLSNRNLRIIDEVFFEDGSNSLKDSLEYKLDIKYEYMTEFNNNLELDLEEYEVVARGVSQAAPIKLVDINLVNSNGDKLEFVIEDRGYGDASVELKEFDFTLGTSRLDCKNYYKTQGSPKKVEGNPVLTKEFSTLLVVCDVDLSQYPENSITTTKTFGSFSYLYTLSEQKVINFDDVRSAGYE
jgi:hypothetical protein